VVLQLGGWEGGYQPTTVKNPNCYETYHRASDQDEFFGKTALAQKNRHTRETGETCIGFWWESPKEKDHLEDQGIDGSMGSKWTFVTLFAGVWSGIHLARDRDHWRAVVVTVMNLRVLVPRS
jgi:hypothetical protein